MEKKWVETKQKNGSGRPKTNIRKIISLLRRGQRKGRLGLPSL